MVTTMISSRPRSYSRGTTPQPSYHRSHRRDNHVHNSSPPTPPGTRDDDGRRHHRREDDRSPSTSHHSSHAKRSSRRHRSSDSESPTRSNTPMQHKRLNPSPSRCLGVFGLHMNTSQPRIREIFERYGPIERIHVVTDANTRRSRGFCFIYFKNLSDARVAKDACTGMQLDGRNIRVDYSVTERSHTPTPGVYKGKPLRRTDYRDRRYRDKCGCHRAYHCYHPRDSRYSNADAERYRRYRSDRSDRHDHYERYARSRYSSHSRSRSRSRSTSTRHRHHHH